MTVLPQGERELLKAHERQRRRHRRRLIGLPSRIRTLELTSRSTQRGADRRGSETRWPVPRITAGLVALIASVAVVLGVAAVFLVVVGKPHISTRAAEQPGSRPTGRRISENGIDPALIRNFAILRRPLRSSDRLPAALSQIATPSAPLNGASRPTSLGLLPDLAREVTFPGTGLRAWLIPGRHGLCWDAVYGSHELGAFCSSFQDPTTALAAANGYDSVKTKTGLITIGLVTDHVLSLTSSRPHGQQTQVPIDEGFFAGYGVSGRKLIAQTAAGPHVLPRASSELVFNAVGSQNSIAPAAPERGALLAQLALRSPAGGRTPQGIAQIYQSRHGDLLTLTVSGVKLNVPHDAYAVWLYTTPHASRLLGFINQPHARSGKLKTSGVLPSDAGRYRQILVTLETQTRPTTPGKIIVNGPLRLHG